MTNVTDTARRLDPITTVESPPDPRWARPTLAALLIATAAFWCIGLSRNGWANAFYAAAVQAGTKSWKAFLFGSSDAANLITVDKPPASLWPMEITARVFGVNTWSIQLPQVLLGVAAVALLYVIVKKQFGPAAGLLAGAALALTPVATLMFRYDNPDALLVFLMIAAVWAAMRAVSDGRTRWMVLCGVLLGLGFLTGGIVTAGPSTSGDGFAANKGPMSEITVSDALASTLLTDADAYTWVAAVSGSTDAAYYQLATDRPVMALGGFSSGDPAPTLDQFKQYVSDGKVHYYIESQMSAMKFGSKEDAPRPPEMNSDNQANRITDWAEGNFTKITVDGVTLYDLSQPLHS